MRYSDPLTIKCTCCGVEGFYPLSLVRDLKAVCNGCGGSFKTQGERINSSILSFELARCLEKLVLAIAEEFVFDASQVEYSSLSTVGDMLDLIGSLSVDLSGPEVKRRLAIVFEANNYLGKIVDDSSFCLSELPTAKFH